MPEVPCLCTGIEADGRSWSLARLAQADGSQWNEVGTLAATDGRTLQSLSCNTMKYSCKGLELLIALKLPLNRR